MKFYQYQGRFDHEGLVDPLRSNDPAIDQSPHVDADGIAYVMLPDNLGNMVRHDLAYVGQQVGGFNANELAAPIPEPRTYVMMLAGLGLLGLAVRRRKSLRREMSNGA
jgi:hypothetical protein